MWRHSLSNRIGQALWLNVIQPWRHANNPPFSQAKHPQPFGHEHQCPILLASQASFHIFLRTVFQVGPMVGFLEERCGAFCRESANRRIDQPLLIPEGLWESVSMDFMVSLPPSRGFDAIMLVVDRFGKMAHFISTKDSATAQETVRLFFTHVFKHHGLPKDIISDREPKFTNKFWRALWKRMGSKLKMSTSFRPQTDGQTKRVNLVI
jgi:hypothetical protein